MSIVTLTMNPAIDISADVAQVLPTHKLRCTSVRRDPRVGLSSITSMLSAACGDFADAMPLGLPCRVNLAGSTGIFWRLICINDPAQRAR